MAKAIEVVLTAVAEGHTTSRDIANVTGLEATVVAARLLDLECARLIERAGIVEKNDDGARGLKRLIQWRLKGTRGW